ncbi:MAG: metallophosphoesterase family protein [Acetivibrionales bacterium]|jgi:putative phosphoesterase
MKILVISDTHGDIDKAREIIKENDGVNLIIHLGDYFRDAEKLSTFFPDIPIEYIYGNSDFMIGDVPGEKILEFQGKRILITHGHRYSVKWGYDKLYRKAEEMNVDILLFGHTHVADMVQKAGYCLLNPGSISDPRDDSSESYAIIEVDSKGVNPRLVYV